MGIVRDETGLTNYSIARLRSMIRVNPISSMLEISTTTTNPAIAQSITAAMINNARDEIVRIMPSCDAKVVDTASWPLGPSGPNVANNTMVGIILGIVAVSLLLLVLDLMDTTIKSPEEISENYKIPVMGSVPNLDDTDSGVISNA